MIDSHQHFWQVGRFDYPWMTSDLGVLYRDYLPDDLAPILTSNGVTKTVLVQASNSIAESRWLLSLADENDFIAGVVGWVDLISPDIDAQLVELTTSSKIQRRQAPCRKRASRRLDHSTGRLIRPEATLDVRIVLRSPGPHSTLKTRPSSCRKLSGTRPRNRSLSQTTDRETRAGRMVAGI